MDNEIRTVSCRVASFLDNKTDRIIYEEAVCEINRANIRHDRDQKDLSLLESSVEELEAAVSKAPSVGKYIAEREMSKVKDALAAIQGRDNGC